MIQHMVGRVVARNDWDCDAQELTVDAGGDVHRIAINYSALLPPPEIGDEVLLNTTACELGLGTGGFDFVVANLSRAGERGANGHAGHIMKGRYLPCQLAVRTLEEAPVHSDVWNRDLDGFTVVVAQLHSQIAPAMAGLKAVGRERLAYIMTDGAALPISFSRLAHRLKEAGWIGSTITCGQAFGGDYETVTLHSALLAARHILGCDAAVVCQGPGNAGTGTRVGFSGIEQAQNLDAVSALGGVPIAVLRMSSADQRPRHAGLSHHTQTVLNLTHARCLVGLPEGQSAESIPSRHDVRIIPSAERAVQTMEASGIEVKSMGRTPAQDPLFFEAAAAAGLAARYSKKDSALYG